jgi:hypothetical protein
MFCFFEFLTCCDFRFGLVTKARACKGVGRERSLGVTFYAFRSVGRRDRMNSHTPKWAFILGVRVTMDSRIFKK